MKTSFILSVGIFGSILLVQLNQMALASTSDLFLSEVQVSGEKSDDEFVEIYNASPDDFDLSGFQLRRKTSGGTESSLKVFGSNTVIPGHGYFLWGNSKGIFASPFADTETSSSALADNNSIGLFTESGASGVLLDSLAWGNGAPFSSSTPLASNPPKNQSLARDFGTLAWSLSQTHTPTNSRGETYVDPLPPPLTTFDIHVRINEILANPSDKGDQGEFIELYNTSPIDVSLSGWVLKDASKTGQYTFPPDTIVKASEYFVVYRKTFNFALNNSDEMVLLLDPNNEKKDQASYNATKEDISWNHVDGKWRGGTPTPGAPNQPNTLPVTKEKVPKVGYRGVAVEFRAHGKDGDKDTLKYTWDFGDDHKSYKENTSHVYEKKGTYTVTLKTSDGKDDALESFTVKIESYPDYDIRITALSVNPDGKDTGNEWLTIANREKKTVNLKGYSIATGWKKLSNHPIREDFLIGAKQERTLTHDLSRFTLPNQKGKIELRSPDGEVLQKIKYKEEKSVADDAVYKKEKGNGWKWITSEKPTDAQAPDDEVEEVADETLVLGVSDAKQEALPLETNADIPLLTAEMLRGQRSIDPNHPDPRVMLSYGTRVTVPFAISLAPLSDEKSDSVIESDLSFSSSTDSLLSRINSTLNNFLNNAY